MQRFSFVLLTAFWLLLPGCSSEGNERSDDTNSEIDCDNETIPTFAEVRAFDVCTNCHSSEREGLDRDGAPPGLNFDVHESAAGAAPRMVDQVSMGSMPPPASGFSITQAQKDELFVWAECGTPE